MLVDGAGGIVLFHPGTDPYPRYLAMIAGRRGIRDIAGADVAPVECWLVPSYEENGAVGLPGLRVHYFGNQDAEKKITLAHAR